MSTFNVNVTMKVTIMKVTIVHIYFLHHFHTNLWQLDCRQSLTITINDTDPLIKDIRFQQKLRFKSLSKSTAIWQKVSKHGLSEGQNNPFRILKQIQFLLCHMATGIIIKIWTISLLSISPLPSGIPCPGASGRHALLTDSFCPFSRCTSFFPYSP